MNKNKPLVLVIFLLLVSFSSSGCAILSRALLPRENVRAVEYKKIDKKEMTMVTSDGIELISDVFIPRGITKAPTILVRIPFIDTIFNQLRAHLIGMHWAKRGYVVVVQGVRGQYKSEGEYYPLINERKDGLETLEWIAKQSWYDGKLGMWGGSAFGHTQWAIADQLTPNASALNIQIASTNFYRMFYPEGGAFSFETALFWALWTNDKNYSQPSIRKLERGLNGFPIIDADNRSDEDIGFFNDWVSNNTFNEYWEQVDGIDRAKTLKAPVLLMAGWYDPFLPDQINDYLNIKSEADKYVADNTQLVIGPWAHAKGVKLPHKAKLKNYRISSLSSSINWFDKHLKKISASNINPSPIRIFVMGKNQWRDEEEWPLARTEYTSYYLTSESGANSVLGDGELTLSQNNKSRVDRFQYDPLNPVPTRGGAMLGHRSGIYKQNDVEEREDVLIYSTPSLEEAVEVTGPVEVILFVKTNVKNTDFTAKLVDVFPNGRAYNLSDGIIRRDYSNDDPTEIRIKLWPTSNVFKKGHKIRLEISSSNFPRYNRNPNTGTDINYETNPVSADQSIFLGNNFPSRLILPIIPIDSN